MNNLNLIFISMEESSQAIIFYLYTLSSEGRHNHVFPGGPDESGGVRKWEMVSEDINATMNYSIMSTRSVITHSRACTHTYARTHSQLYICPLFQASQGWQSGGGVPGRGSGLSMTNRQIICSIRTESRCAGRGSGPGRHCCGPNNRLRENT